MYGHEEALWESWRWRGYVPAGGGLRTRLLFSHLKSASWWQKLKAESNKQKRHAACTNYKHYYLSSTALARHTHPVLHTHTPRRDAGIGLLTELGVRCSIMMNTEEQKDTSSTNLFLPF